MACQKREFLGVVRKQANLAGCKLSRAMDELRFFLANAGKHHAIMKTFAVLYCAFEA